MNTDKIYNHLIDFVNELHSEGRYTFTKDEIKKVYRGTDNALKSALRRAAGKKRIAAIRRGFYVIIPNEYLRSGILPPHLFVDDLMNFIGLPYYVALASAGALYGAAHQQILAFQVMIPEPRRDIIVNGLTIRFFVKKCFPARGLTRHKTDTGYLTVSSPELTAIDLVAYEKRIGGLNRIVTILADLQRKLNPAKLLNEAERYSSIVYAQRLGYLLEAVDSRSKQTSNLAAWINSQAPPYTPLEPGFGGGNGTRNGRWKLIVNTEIGGDI